ncbi:MAG: hypothetical protein ABJK10_27225, partial [Rhodopirellula bahusiensis]
GSHAGGLEISVHESTIVLDGELPNAELRKQLVPLIRQAGVLWQVENNVAVKATPTAAAS